MHHLNIGKLVVQLNILLVIIGVPRAKNNTKLAYRCAGHLAELATRHPEAFSFGDSQKLENVLQNKIWKGEQWKRHRGRLLHACARTAIEYGQREQTCQSALHDHHRV